MTEYAREFIRSKLAFSFRSTEHPSEAPYWEDELGLGVLGQRPLMNALPLS